MRILCAWCFYPGYNCLEYRTLLGRLKLIVCFASRFFQNPIRECENKTHSIEKLHLVTKAVFWKNYSILPSNDVCVFLCWNVEIPMRALTQNIQLILNGLTGNPQADRMFFKTQGSREDFYTRGCLSELTSISMGCRNLRLWPRPQSWAWGQTKVLNHEAEDTAVMSSTSRGRGQIFYRTSKSPHEDFMRTYEAKYK